MRGEDAELGMRGQPQGPEARQGQGDRGTRQVAGGSGRHNPLELSPTLLGTQGGALSHSCWVVAGQGARHCPPSLVWTVRGPSQ